MKHPVRHLHIIAALALLAATPFALALYSDAVPGPAAQGAEAAGDAATIERGRYLVTVAACGDCHTPLKLGPNGPEPDLSRMLSGHPQELQLPPPPVLPEGPWQVVGSATVTAWSGPWGVSYTANLTPDDDTGLGLWTYENFRDTIRSGRHLGRGREILPPMPIAHYRHFTDQDLEAIYRYLRTIPPVSNRVPEPLPPASRP